MIFLLSGEGPTDIGVCTSVADLCHGNDFAPGPMALMIDQVVERCWEYSILETNAVRFVSETQLVDRAGELKSAKKSLRLPGVRTHKETRYFFNNARLLARIANQLQDEASDDVIAVLFRDADGTASAGRGEWNDKRQSMQDGFNEEQFSRGVAMIPKPKSEAWLLCALKPQAYQRCSDLEERSGNDRSPHSLKAELAAILGEDLVGRDRLVQIFTERGIDVEKIDMPSFKAFRTALRDAMELAEPA